jgi:hypothetical protein
VEEGRPEGFGLDIHAKILPPALGIDVDGD